MILRTSLASLFLIQMIFIVSSVAPSHPLAFGCTVAAATAVFALQLCNCSPGAERWPTWQRGAMVLSQVVVTFLPLLAFGIMWTGMTSFLAGSVLLLVPQGKARVPFGAIAIVIAIAIGTCAAAVATGQGASGIAFASISPALGIVVFGLSRMEMHVRHAYAGQAEIAQFAALKERARFAGDLHDLLGFSLSAIALKAELSRRVMATKPDLACQELADVVDFARQAVTDVRLVADGYRAMSLATEARSAASLLSAAQIVADIEIDCGLLDSKVDTVLATILREAVTNFLRHSTARNCRIVARQADDSVTLLVANDGAAKSVAACREGLGLVNLAARLESVGGTLTSESRDGTFVLFAAVPQTVRGDRRLAPRKRGARVHAWLGHGTVST